MKTWGLYGAVIKDEHYLVYTGPWNLCVDVMSGVNVQKFWGHFRIVKREYHPLNVCLEEVHHPEIPLVPEGK